MIDPIKDVEKIKELKQRLIEGIVEVEFEKADGSLRQMKCTLDPKVLPPSESNFEEGEENRNRKPNEAIQVVWDIEAGGYRSFRFDRIRNIK